MPWHKATVTYERGRYGVLATMTGRVETGQYPSEGYIRERGSFIRFRDDDHPGRTRHIPTRTLVMVDITEEDE